LFDKLYCMNFQLAPNRRFLYLLFWATREHFVSTGFSQELCARVDGELKHFNEAFAAALKAETSQNLEDLVDAADRLMRAIGRVLIEVKRQLGN
jgi:hypothetical protein